MHQHLSVVCDARHLTGNTCLCGSLQLWFGCSTLEFFTYGSLPCAGFTAQNKILRILLANFVGQHTSLHIYTPEQLLVTTCTCTSILLKASPAVWSGGHTASCAAYSRKRWQAKFGSETGQGCKAPLKQSSDASPPPTYVWRGWPIMMKHVITLFK